MQPQYAATPYQPLDLPIVGVNRDAGRSLVKPKISIVIAFVLLVLICVTTATNGWLEASLPENQDLRVGLFKTCVSDTASTQCTDTSDFCVLADNMCSRIKGIIGLLIFSLLCSLAVIACLAYVIKGTDSRLPPILSCILFSIITLFVFIAAMVSVSIKKDIDNAVDGQDTSVKLGYDFGAAVVIFVFSGACAVLMGFFTWSK